jgi:nuclear transport factor 2 (NTF2) superfamily protein
MATQTTSRPPLPPFTHESAIQNVRLAEDGWNTRDPAKVALAYTIDSRWRNRSEFISGRSEIIAFLSRKWAKELDYRLIKEMWVFTGNRIAVRFAYESTMTRVTGIAPMAMRTGSSMTMGSWRHGMHQSTTSPF